MKIPVKTIILISVILLLCIVSPEIFAGTEPPHPGYDPAGGRPPVGGDAPIDNGTLLMIIAGLSYLSWKMRLRVKSLIYRIL